MNIEIRDSAIEARIQRQIQATGAASASSSCTLWRSVGKVFFDPVQN
jgi:hypothetical protein